MTYRELALKEQPDWVWWGFQGGVCCCPSDLLNGAKELCEKGCPSNDSEDRCTRCWNQEISDQPSQSAKSDKGGTMITLNLDRDDIKNLIEFFELSFFDHLKKLLDADELDNMEYLKSMTRVYDELNRELGAEEEA